MGRLRIFFGGGSLWGSMERENVGELKEVNDPYGIVLWKGITTGGIIPEGDQTHSG